MRRVSFIVLAWMAERTRARCRSLSSSSGVANTESTNMWMRRTSSAHDNHLHRISAIGGPATAGAEVEPALGTPASPSYSLIHLPVVSSSSFPQLLRALDGPLLLAEIWSGRSINRRNKKEKRKDYIIPGGGCDICEWVNEWLTAQIYRLDPWPPASMHSTPNPWMSNTFDRITTTGVQRRWTI